MNESDEIILNLMQQNNQILYDKSLSLNHPLKKYINNKTLLVCLV